jgi:hypothetical protein
MQIGSKTFPVTLFWFHRAFWNINYVLHQPNEHIYLKNIKIFYKMLDKKPQHMFWLIDKPKHMLGVFLSNIL